MVTIIDRTEREMNKAKRIVMVLVVIFVIFVEGVRAILRESTT